MWEIRLLNEQLLLFCFAIQTLEATMKNIPKDRHGKMPKEYLRVALDVVAPSAGLPPFGAVDEVHN